MKALIVLLVACLNFAGCVGINVPTAPKTLSYNVTKETSSPPKLWDGVSHPADGKVTVRSKREWCGYTVWVLIPIPLWLPICKAHTDVTFENNEAIKVESFDPNSTLYACGPFMPFLGMSGTHVGFCGSASYK